MAIFNRNKINYVKQDSNTFNDIKVVGVGGGGGNTINHMFRQEVPNVDFAICNTDKAVLDESPVSQKLQLGPSLTLGKGTGSIPKVGRQAAEESIEDIRALFPVQTEMVFVTAGMGGGTGTGAGPIVARAAKEMGKLTIGIVTTPFDFEGRDAVAQDGLQEMGESVDALMVIDNNKIFDAFEDTCMQDSFGMVNEVLNNVASNVADIVTRTLEVNVDMNDMRSLLSGSRTAMLGTGISSGENLIDDIITQIFSSPFMSDVDVYDSSGFIFVITYGNGGFTGKVMRGITNAIREKVGPKPVCIKWGYGYNPDLEDGQVKVTFITAGFPNGMPQRHSESKQDAKTTRHELSPVDKPINGVSPMPLVGKPFRKEMRRDKNGTEKEYTIYSLSTNTNANVSASFAQEVKKSSAQKYSNERKRSDMCPSPMDATIEEVFSYPMTMRITTSKTESKLSTTWRSSDPAFRRQGIMIKINPPLEGRTNTFTLQ